MNKQSLCFTFFLLMSLTLPLTATAQVVDIPDPNLRAAIENALSKVSGAIITSDEMATLTGFAARNANIRDLTGLEHATNLKWLGLDGEIVDGTWNNSNSISDLSPLAGLTNLTQLWIGGNVISDLSPLVGLTNLTSLTLEANRISDLSPLVANTGLGSGDEVYLRGNPLSHTSIKTHIPTLQGRGVTVKFDDTTNLNVDEPRTVEFDNTKNLNVGEPHTVRLIYFLPSNRSPQRDIDTKLDTLIEDVQQFYADEMQHHGLGGKTFTFETDATRKVVVHHVDGQFTDSYYRQNTFHKVWEEIREQFYTSQNIYFIAIDIGNERVGRGYEEVCGVGDSHGASSGHVLIPASGDCFNLKTAAHEFGHAFGLQHDFRNDTYIMSFGRNPNRLSECAAEWLDAHRYFNTGQSQTHFDNPTTIQMLTPFVSPPYAIGLRFETTDPDGVHQAQLLTPATIRNQGLWQSKLLSCKRLNGETDTIAIEFITNQLTVKSNEVTLSVIDVYGNFTSQMYPIDITTILPTETASIPDRNQVFNIPEPVPPPFTIRDAFELDTFYQQWIDVEGLPVVGSAKVNPYALKEAAWLIRQMIGHRPEVLQALVQKRVRFSVVAHNEIITEIPEYSDYRPDFLVYRIRGFGGSGVSGHPAVSSGEENILGYPNGSGGETASTLIHEFSHAVHLMGLNPVDPAFDDRLKIAYDAAMTKGLWQGTYASSDRREYWAVGAVYFFLRRTMKHDFQGAPVSTWTELKNYDPDLATLLTEIYSDSGWLYTPPAARTHLPHLQGFFPQDSPTFQLPPELEELERQFRNPNIEGGDEWVDLRPYDPSLLSSLNESRTVGDPTEVFFMNFMDIDVLVYGVSYDGTEGFWTRIPPDPRYIRGHSCKTNDIWLIKDSNGRNLAVFKAVKKTGRAIVSMVPIETDPVDILDTNLHAVIETAFGRAEGGPITPRGLAALRTLEASEAGISDLTGLEHATNLRDLHLWRNSVSDLSPLAGLTKLTGLYLGENSVSDLSPLAGLTNLESLFLDSNGISNLSALAGLTQLTRLALNNNSISDLSPLAGLTNLRWMRLASNKISDLSPLVANKGLGSGDQVLLNDNPLSYLSIHTHILTLRSRGVTVEFDNRTHPALLKISGDDQKGASFAPLSHPFVVEAQAANGSALAGVSVTFAVTAGGGTLSTTLTRTDEKGRAQSTLTLGPNLGTNTAEVSAAGIEGTATFHAIADTFPTEYLWSVPAGISLIHVPLKVTVVDGVAQTITSIVDLYDALGGVGAVNFLITYDSQAQEWRSYFGTSDTGTPADKRLTDDIGIIAGMIAPASIRLSGTPLGINGTSTITLNQGLNLVGLPLRDLRITHVSDLFTLDGIGSNVPVIILTNNGEFKAVGRARDSGDIEIIGGQSFIMTAQREAMITISGDGWYNSSAMAAAPPVGNADLHSIITGIQVTDTTPVLVLRGSIVSEGTGVNQVGTRITVKNLSTGRELATVTAPDGTDYRLAVVDIETGQAAQIGDILEISAQSPNPLIGVQPLRYTVTAEDVKRGLIQLTELVAYEIPTETELLRNYPNPFNPETWIPYRLVEDAFVTLTIYDGSGRVIRTLDVGHRIAAVYESQSKAIYWDGRNGLGEQVASGVYFYTLTAGDYSATRKMVILK